MAYGTKYYFEAPGLRESEYRCELQKDGYSSGATSITRSMDSLRFRAGKSDLEFDAALQPTWAEITLRDQSVIQEIYGSDDRVWRANIEKRLSDTDPWVQWFRGFVLGDMGDYDPGAYKGPMTIEAVDGMELVRNVNRPVDTTSERHSVWTLIDDALGAINLGIPYRVAWPWYYRLDKTSDAELDPSDTKLQTLYAWERALQEDRDKPEDEGDLLPHYKLLQQTLKTLNLRIVQSEGEWWIRQRHQARYGATDTHQYSVGNSTPNQTTSEDFVKDLGAMNVSVEERPSRFKRNLGEYSVIHNFGPYTGRGLPEGGLETLDNWTLIDSSGEYITSHDDHDTTVAPTPDKTQQNTKLVRVTLDFTSYPFFAKYLESDTFQFPSSGRSDEVFRLSFKHASQFRDDAFVQAVRVQHGGYYLDGVGSEIQADVVKGKNVIVPVDNVEAPIPRDTTLRVFSGDRDLGKPLDVVTEINLTEKAQQGQSYLVGDLADDIVLSDYVNSRPVVRYYTWSGTQTNARFHHMFIEDSWAERQLVAFMQDQNGNVVQGTDMKITFAGLQTTGVNDDRFYDYAAAVDDIRVRLTLGDSVVSQAEHDTFTGNQTAAQKEHTTFLGDGPSADSKARLHYYNPSTGGEQLRLNEWLDDPFNIGVTGIKLGHLRGREYVRELRDKHREMTLRIHLQDPSAAFGPHWLLKWDGQLWSIEDYDHIPDRGWIEVVANPILDEGTSGLTYTSKLTTGDDADSSGSVSSTQSGGGGPVGTTAVFHEIETSSVGSLPPDAFVIRHKANNAIILNRLLVDGETQTTAQFDLIVDVLHPDGTTTSIKTVSIGSGVRKFEDTNWGQTVAAKDVLRVKTDVDTGNFNRDFKDVSINFDVDPAP